MDASEQAREELRRRVAGELAAADAADANAQRAAVRAARLRVDPTATATVIAIRIATEEAERAAILSALRNRELHDAIVAAVLKLRD